MRQLTIEDFQDKAGQTFKVRQGGQEIDLTLVKVEARKPSAPGLQRTPFALFFAGPQGVALQQQTYTLTHESAGELLVFLVPIGRNADGTYTYQAVFN